MCKSNYYCLSIKPKYLLLLLFLLPLVTSACVVVPAHRNGLSHNVNYGWKVSYEDRRNLLKDVKNICLTVSTPRQSEIKGSKSRKKPSWIDMESAFRERLGLWFREAGCKAFDSFLETSDVERSRRQTCDAVLEVNYKARTLCAKYNIGGWRCPGRRTWGNVALYVGDNLVYKTRFYGNVDVPYSISLPERPYKWSLLAVKKSGLKEVVDVICAWIKISSGETTQKDIFYLTKQGERWLIDELIVTDEEIDLNKINL